VESSRVPAMRSNRWNRWPGLPMYPRAVWRQQGHYAIAQARWRIRTQSPAAALPTVAAATEGPSAVGFECPAAGEPPQTGASGLSPWPLRATRAAITLKSRCSVEAASLPADRRSDSNLEIVVAAVVCNACTARFPTTSVVRCPLLGRLLQSLQFLATF
jgi:hypothetical protein